MTLYIALLRGVNVGGYKLVAMSDLRELLTKLGFTDARSLLQSGNLTFRGGKRSALHLERMLAAEVLKRLHLETEFFIRSAEEWNAIVAANPFPNEAARDPARLLVMFLKQAPDPQRVKALRAGIAGREVVRVDGRHAYIVYPDGVGRSRLTGAVIEKTLSTRGTGRNWNTVLKLGALAAL